MEDRTRDAQRKEGCQTFRGFAPVAALCSSCGSSLPCATLAVASLSIPVSMQTAHRCAPSIALAQALHPSVDAALYLYLKHKRDWESALKKGLLKGKKMQPQDGPAKKAKKVKAPVIKNAGERGECAFAALELPWSALTCWRGHEAVGRWPPLSGPWYGLKACHGVFAVGRKMSRAKVLAGGALKERPELYDI